MIEQLFGSKTRVKLLRLFYSNPNRSFYVREITRKIDEQINSVRRELANLLSIGIIGSDNNDNKLYYEVNQSYEYYQPLVAIFGTDGAKKEKKSSRTAVASTNQDDDLASIGNVELAIFTGLFTRDERSGTDILIVGDVNQTKLQKYIATLEEKEGKDLRYTVITPADLQYRLEVKDRFVSNVLLSKKQILIDKNNAINKEGE